MSVSVATLNLHCGLDSRGVAYSVDAAVGALAADVVLVQENWRPAGADSLARRAALAGGYEHLAELDIVRHTPLRDLKIIPGEVPDESGAWGLAVLSRFPVRAYRTVALGTAPGDVAGARAAQVLEVTDANGTPLRVVNVHLTHRLAHGPAQLRRLLRALRDTAEQEDAAGRGEPGAGAVGRGAAEGGARGEDAMRRGGEGAGRGDARQGSELPTVIGGDFNMCRPVVYLSRGYRPLVRGRTWPAHRPVAQLDHLLAGPGVTLAAQEVGRPVGSDHLPVRAQLALAGERRTELVADRVPG